MAVINWKWSEMSLIKIKALLSISTLAFVRSNLVFHAYVFFIIQILMVFRQISCPTYFWSITLTLKVQILPKSNTMSLFTICSKKFYLYLFKKAVQLSDARYHFLIYFEKLPDGIFFSASLTFQLTAEKVI